MGDAQPTGSGGCTDGRDLTSPEKVVLGCSTLVGSQLQIRQRHPQRLWLLVRQDEGRMERLLPCPLSDQENEVLVVETRLHRSCSENLLLKQERYMKSGVSIFG